MLLLAVAKHAKPGLIKTNNFMRPVLTFSEIEEVNIGLRLDARFETDPP